MADVIQDLDIGDVARVRALMKPAEMTVNAATPFSFRSIVPQGWSVVQMSQTPPTAEKLTPVAVLQSPTDPKASLQIQAVRLEHEISATDWLIHYARIQKWLSEKIEDFGGKAARGPMLLSVNGVNLAAFVAAYIQRDLLILYQAICGADDAQRYAGAFNLMVRSFEPTEAPTQAFVEPFAFQVLDRKVRFLAPASWPAQITASGQNHRHAMDFVRTDKAGAVVGICRAKLILPGGVASYDEVFRGVYRELQEAGLGFVSEMANVDGGVGLRAEPGRIVAYSMKTAVGLEVEARILVAENKGAYFVLRMTGPAATSDFYEWAINSRCFELMSKSIEWA